MNKEIVKMYVIVNTEKAFLMGEKGGGICKPTVYLSRGVAIDSIKDLWFYDYRNPGEYVVKEIDVEVPKAPFGTRVPYLETLWATFECPDDQDEVFISSRNLLFPKSISVRKPHPLIASPHMKTVMLMVDTCNYEHLELGIGSEIRVYLDRNEKGMFCQINNHPDRDGMNTKGKYFFIDKACTADVHINDDVFVTITKEFDTYGFVIAELREDRLFRGIPTTEKETPYIDHADMIEYLESLSEELGEYYNFKVCGRFNYCGGKAHKGTNYLIKYEELRYIIRRDPDTGKIERYEVDDIIANSIFDSYIKIGTDYDFASSLIGSIRYMDPKGSGEMLNDCVRLIGNRNVRTFNYVGHRWGDVGSKEVYLRDEYLDKALAEGLIKASRLGANSIYYLTFTDNAGDKLIKWYKEDIKDLIDQVKDYNNYTADCIASFVATGKLVKAGW